MARQGDLRRVLHGVYALPGSFTSPREATIANWLRLSGQQLPWQGASPEAVISHATAASLHGFGTFSSSAPSFTVFRRRFQPSDESLRLFTAQLEPSDWQWIVLPEGIEVAVTTPARTIVDLAFAGEEADRVLDALAEARDAGMVDEGAVSAALSRRRRRRGRGKTSWLANALEHA